jgi:hypothetical protein
MANGISFIFQNNQTSLVGNTVTNAPYVQAIQQSSAQQLSGRVPGGGSYKAGSQSVSNSIVQIDGMETQAASLGYAKNAAVGLTLNGAVNSTISLAALTANATTIGANSASLATDSTFTAFNALNMIIVYNMSGIAGDTTNSILTVTSGAANGASINTVVISPASRFVLESTGNGVTVNATKATITLAGNGQNVSVVVMGS